MHVCVRLRDFSSLATFQNCVYVLKRWKWRVFLLKVNSWKGSPLLLAVIQLVLGLQRVFRPVALQPHIQQGKRPCPFVLAPSCWCSWFLTAHLSSFVFCCCFLWGVGVRDLKDRRLPCDPSLFLSNDTQPWFGWLIYWHWTRRNKNECSQLINPWA